jgi:hypothetical protein
MNVSFHLKAFIKRRLAMKNVWIVFLTLGCIGLTLSAQAATVTFNPSVAEFKVAVGETASTGFMAQGFSRLPYSLNFRVGSRLENSNVPPGWLHPVNLNLSSRIGGPSSSPLDLKVSVPGEAKAGIYTGMLVPEDMRSSEPITSPGVIISIEVIEPQKACSGLPVFSDVEISPQNAWAPTESEIEIVLSGIVSGVSGCEITAGYTLESNSGISSGNITLGADGHFAEKVKINVSKNGREKYGRIYNGSLFATYNEGVQADFDFFITVEHDKGNKVSSNQ